MTAINANTRAVIKGYLEGFIQGLIDEYKGRKILKPTTAIEYLSRRSSNGELKPFQAALIPPELIRINQFERGLSTKLGNSFEECARLIALEHHQDVRRGFDIKAEVSIAAFAEAELQKQNYESAAKTEQGKPSFEQMITAVLNARRNDDLETKIVRVDLYILSKDGTEFFFEIKAPKPNKGQCLEVLQRLLRFHLLRGVNRPQVQSYYAMPYNPYGVNKADYKWTQAKSYLPFDKAVVIGNEFWSIVGGATAYEELLEIYLEVGREKSKYMLDNLAFGF
ncbi:TdeIII family type II restriction endonuclease [Nodularia spumigena]|uniref:TdeIII family type II restriction endonuclease n=1 Tax=Nodularia spumigena TaxID=70799 RepID=UPI00232AA4F7|nr:TdeIII family type II restriction endonuclease [Nodularia spumigena]MDB9317725.1 TdeIII family type II restriction endonuclease [Nodularia spumigena CS-590/01A]MDB9322856.1 TdeIII family type II restriction endonuclease [Nodularia spumigena CS-591/07A]MDB9326112.1 TdeIII family type II restriction endonuclease [Nodularia spumigena CS-590/02]MDB9330348.1 TdeIII family type II restriction endonuclease [Nodularia spumigena CS-591/04]MDB9336680.1 TdeIII family type II restriction endonuclease [